MSKSASSCFDSLENQALRTPEIEQILKYSRMAIKQHGISMKEIYNEELYGHCERVAAIAVIIGNAYRFNLHELIHLGMGGYLHDIGKCSISDQIIDKPGNLNRTEYQLIQSHPSIGYRNLQEYQLPDDVMEMVLSHHERLDGSGYPVGECRLSIFTQLITIADIFDASHSRRVYHEKRTMEEVFDILDHSTGINTVAVSILKSLIFHTTKKK